jgi:hypothetical protein
MSEIESPGERIVRFKEILRDQPLPNHQGTYNKFSTTIVRRTLHFADRVASRMGTCVKDYADLLEVLESSTEEDLLQFKGVGRKSLCMIRDMLMSSGRLDHTHWLMQGVTNVEFFRAKYRHHTKEIPHGS